MQHLAHLSGVLVRAAVLGGSPYHLPTQSSDGGRTTLLATTVASIRLHVEPLDTLGNLELDNQPSALRQQDVEQDWRQDHKRIPIGRW